MKRPHGSPPRGMLGNPLSPAFEGTYGRMFRTLPAAKFTTAALMDLGDAMVSKDRPDLSEGEDDEENPGIQAGYTYFGQFIDHDLTFDPASVLQKIDDPDGLIDYRTPRFDLDNLYGRGPDDQPYMYEPDGIRLLLGEEIEGNHKDKKAKGLARNQAHPARAIIGDPRNDENTLVSQLQAGFIRFHNWMAGHLLEIHPKTTFADVQKQVRWHYQWLVFNEFLPTIIQSDVLDQVLPNRKSGGTILDTPPVLKFYSWKKYPFIPVEFSVAAYRFGHSMVRPFYRLNAGVKKTIFAKEAEESLDGFRKLPKGWAIDWDLFLGLKDGTNEGPQRVQRAYKIDTSLVNPLIDLFNNHAISDQPANLAQRNLIRGREFSLPSGQTVAKFMGIVPISDENLKVGKATEDNTNGNVKNHIEKNKSITAISKEFTGNAPLWFYILAEAQQSFVDNNSKIRLGAVGGRIITEVFVGLLLGDQHSYLSQHPEWLPIEALGGKNFNLKKLLTVDL